MRRCLYFAWIACLPLFGCAKDDDDKTSEPCAAYLDCLANVDPDLFDEEVLTYGANGSCLDSGDASSCGQACATRLEAYARRPECGAEIEPGAVGSPGGLCLAPNGTCSFGICNRDANYCYDAEDPCLGFECGGENRGTCTPVNALPACACEPGFENETFALYCCPTDGTDPDCG